MKNLLSNITIRQKLVFLLLFVAFAYAISSIIIITNQVIVSKEQALKSNKLEIIAIAEEIDSRLDQLTSVSNFYYKDSELQDALANNQPLPNNIFTKYNLVCDDLSFSVFLVKNDSELCSQNPHFLKSKTLDLNTFDWYDNINNAQVSPIYIFDEKLQQTLGTSNSKDLYIIRELHDFENWEPIGTLIIKLPQSELRKIYTNSIHSYQSLYIVNADHEILSSIDNIGLGDNPPYDKNITNIFSSFGYSGNNLISHYSLLKQNFYLIFFSDTAVILEPHIPTLFLIITVLSLFFIICLFISAIFKKQLFNPVENLYNAILRAISGDFETKSHILSNDEIGQVTAAFNDLLDKVQTLMDDIVTEQKAKRDAELIAFQTQINPHFLYNTLASIRYHIYSEDKKTADQIILSLTQIMKNTLSNQNEFIDIQDEIKFLKYYIEIQKYTMPEGEFSCEFMIDDNIKNYKTIKLLLQPIVENAIMHGLKPKKTDMKLTIRGYTCEDNVIFKVVDNGVGFKNDYKFKSNKICDDTFEHIGISNVYKRIRLTYGAKYSLSIFSKENLGTAVTITIPVIKEEAKYEYFNRGR